MVSNLKIIEVQVRDIVEVMTTDGFFHEKNTHDTAKRLL
jgi:hypothetical protein